MSVESERTSLNGSAGREAGVRVASGGPSGVSGAGSGAGSGTVPAGGSGGEAPSEHLDVLVVGAGLSGVGAACHLQTRCPGTTYAILESRDTLGGTWDLFRYPGVRSDSDMYTLGYAFRPWPGSKSITDGPSILEYVRDTARDHGVDAKIRYRRRVVRADWSSADARWTVEVEHTDTTQRSTLTCGFLLGCTGYYHYEQGFTPAFAGTGDFAGRIVHPQHWPDDLDYAGKRVVVIGSGATAVTLVPAMAETAGHVTMLQRSPTYIVSLPARDPLAGALRRVLPETTAYSVLRWKNALLMMAGFKISKRWPEQVRGRIRDAARKQLPDGYDVDTAFTPRYDPWDQRMCVVPDGDLFAAIAGGRASIVTDTVDTFTGNGVRLGSGAELEADIVVTATGLNMQLLGGMTVAVDGRPVELSDTVGYKGMMLSGVPNLAIATGYTNASWTLKVDLVARHVCRLLNHMRANGYRQVTPRRPDPSLPTLPFIDLSSGYVQRSAAAFPKQGARTPWRLHQNYLRDLLMFRFSSLADPALEFSAGGVPSGTTRERVAV
jgi:cation diffusion facilitator CzcD-associated flavoprotein CzcO